MDRSVVLRWMGQRMRPILVLVPDDVRLSADVINLSDVRLSEDQLAILNASVKFREVPKDIPVLELVAGVESAARDLERLVSVRSQKMLLSFIRLVHRLYKPLKNTIQSCLLGLGISSLI